MRASEVAGRGEHLPPRSQPCHESVVRSAELTLKRIHSRKVRRVGLPGHVDAARAVHADGTTAIRAAGATLVAVSPELPDRANETQARHALEFDVLSDVGNRISEAFGLVFELPQQLRPIYARLGIDVPAYNGDDSFTLPVPASYLIDSDGVIRYHFVNVDYTQRLEPDTLLDALRAQ